MRATLPDAATLLAAAARAGPGNWLGWQQHHLIPRSLCRRPQIAEFLDHLTTTPGPGVIDGSANLLWLPGTEALAADSGMSLHRGPHARYDELVAARLDKLRNAGLAPADARQRIARLQAALTAALSGRHGPALILNRHDPMRMFSDYAVLDEAIAALIGPTDQPR